MQSRKVQSSPVQSVVRRQDVVIPTEMLTNQASALLSEEPGGGGCKPYSQSGQASSAQLISVQYSTVQFSSVRLSSVQLSSVQLRSVQFSSVQFSSAQFSSSQLSSVQSSQLFDDRMLCFLPNYWPAQHLGFFGTSQGVVLANRKVSQFSSCRCSAVQSSPVQSVSRSTTRCRDSYRNANQPSICAFFGRARGWWLQTLQSVRSGQVSSAQLSSVQLNSFQFSSLQFNSVQFNSAQLLLRIAQHYSTLLKIA